MDSSLDIKFWYLRDHKLFWTLTRAQLKELCWITRFKKAKKGESIQFSEGDDSRIFFLKKGTIKIVEIDSDGNEKIKEVLKKGDLFGELNFEEKNEEFEYAKVLSDDVVLCSFLQSDFEKLMISYPELSLSYTKFIGVKWKKLKSNYANLVGKDAKSRLILFFKEMIQQEDFQGDNLLTVDNYLTQNDISQLICASRQTTTQLINELEAKNLLFYNRKEIIFPNPASFLEIVV